MLRPIVMAGPDPAIHDFSRVVAMDARIKSGHDGNFAGTP